MTHLLKCWNPLKKQEVDTETLSYHEMSDFFLSPSAWFDFHTGGDDDGGVLV